jgi:CubicO group peptidase (beta-lactamase class C family)
MKKIFYLFTLLFSVAAGQASAQITNDPVSAQMDTIFKKYIYTKGPGATVAVCRDGRVVFKKSYGFANLECAQPVNSASIFDLCSLTKQFTGLAISTLIQERKITLNDDIRKYLPHVPDFGKIITINHLVHHTSGLRDYPEALMIAGWRYTELCTRDDVMDFVSRQKDLDFEPGSKESYCNTDYVLLAAIVEKVTGKSFPEWMKENVFKPLQMDNSFILSNSRDIIPNLATSYSPADHGYQKYNDILSAYGSSCMYSSLDDLSKWVFHFQYMLENKDPVYTRMLDGSILNNGDEVSYGFGLEQDTYQGLKTIWHTGAWCGYRTAIINYPGQRFAIIVLSNAEDNDIGGLYLREIAAVFLKDKLKTNSQEVERVKLLPAVELDTVVLQKYTGRFKMEINNGPALNFTIEKGQLVGHNGNVSFALEAKSESCFYDPSDHATIAFDNSNSFVFRDAGITIHASRTTAEAAKAIKFDPTTEQLEAFAGTYYSEELETFYKIKVENGQLAMYHFRRGEFDLHVNQYTPNEFSSSTGTLAFYLDAKKHIAGFKLTGDRVRNIRFIKQSVN